MRTIDEIKIAERKRISSIQEDQGRDAAIAFAKQAYAAYRAQRKMRPMKYGQPYRTELIVSCLVFRKFLREIL
jgi:hypothetical protein